MCSRRRPGRNPLRRSRRIPRSRDPLASRNGRRNGRSRRIREGRDRSCRTDCSASSSSKRVRGPSSSSRYCPLTTARRPGPKQIASRGGPQRKVRRRPGAVRGPPAAEPAQDLSSEQPSESSESSPPAQPAQSARDRRHKAGGYRGSPGPCGPLNCRHKAGGYLDTLADGKKGSCAVSRQSVPCAESAQCCLKRWQRCSQ